MKTKFSGILTLFLALIVQISFAQEKTISGVVSDETGPLPGVSILKKGTTQGTETDFDGKYSIKAKAGDVLVFSFIGMETIEKTIGASNSISLVMKSGNVLDEVIVTGVAGATSKKKLAISAETVSQDLLENVPATSASSAIQGKVSGVTVVQPSGLPGSSSVITIRGATSLLGSQSPLIIVDGVLLASNNLSDINSEDIKSFEILKGAAAASLYGSKAANGVIQIITKRGKGLTEPVTTLRSEFGVNNILRGYDIMKTHAYKLNSDGTFFRNAKGGLVLDSEKTNDHAVLDNPFPSITDNFSKAFGTGMFRTLSASVAGGFEKGNYYASFQDHKNEGIVKIGDLGYGRRSGKVNLDFDISEKWSISTSNSYSSSKSREPDVGGGGPLYALQFTPPHIDLSETNSDGTPYKWDAFEAANWPTAETNPFYYLNNYKYKANRGRLLSSSTLKFKANDWLTLSGTYGLDNLNVDINTFVDKSWLDTEQPNFINGFVRLRKYSIKNENIQLDASTNNNFGDDLEITSKIQFLQENEQYSNLSVRGSELQYLGINNIENVKQEHLSSNSSRTQEVAKSYAGILNMIYKDRYILDALARFEQVSTYGPLARDQWFYRIAGAYRIGMDLNQDWIDEFKIRASYGTSGLRPSFESQYETIKLKDGNGSKDQFGNSKLGASVSKELEVGFNFDFMNRFRTSFTLSNTNNENLVIPIPQAAPAGGFESKWVNAGSIESMVYEASLGIDVIKKQDINWNLNFLFSKYKSSITKFERSNFQTGPESAFLLRAGEEYGSFYGLKAMTSLEQLPKGTDPSKYKIYKGNVVINDGTNRVQFLKNESGADLVTKIGNTTPDFNLSFNSSISYKGFTLYGLLDWQQGGNVYNQTKQWRFRELMDPSVTGETTGYASSVYQINKINDFFVEDATFIKLRELSLKYSFPKLVTDKLSLKGLSLGIAGRNLFIISDYSGIDPEVSDTTAPESANNDLTNYRFDAFGYPSVRTFTGTLTIKL